jgi:catechol 2,3-dioxygenase-like lactoylglutathione lyase family enzyme
MAILTWLGIPGPAEAWAKLGFTIEGGRFQVGQVCCETGTDPAWGFDELQGDTSKLGVPTKVIASTRDDTKQPNGIDIVDHIVYTVPVLDEAIDSLTETLGMPPRRRFHPRGPDGPEMAFYRVGEAFIEVVSSGRRPELIGVAFSSPDLDATVEAIRAAGGPVGDPKPAVQGGRIASVWGGHVDWGVAIMEPPARQATVS